MLKLLMAIGLMLSFIEASGQVKTIHVFVALCDNKNQGIVPVPKAIGNGQDPKSNLYWGAAYGIKNYLQHKTTDWKLVSTLPPGNTAVLERLLFKHATQEVYLVADAYDGAKIKTCTEDFLKSANGQLPLNIRHKELTLNAGGNADLLAYIGHDGLMDFEVNVKYRPSVAKTTDVMILACYSKSYFAPEIRKAKAKPILWTTHLMAPEAYTLKAAIDGWLQQETGPAIKERAAQAYHKYQKCGITGARNLFTSGF